MSASEAAPRRVTTGVLGRAGWVLVDWAFQPFLVLSAFVFAPYFANEIVGDPVAGQSRWGFMLGAVGLVVGLSSPLLGAVADVVGRRKRWIGLASVLTMGGASALWFADPQQGALFALVFYGLALAGSEFASVFYNAMLPSLAPPQTMGRLSGVGWGMGYAGGLVALVLVLSTLVLPEVPAFGLDATAFEAERAVMPLSALWLALFLIPFFVFTPDLPASAMGLRAGAGAGLARLRHTVGEARRLGNVGRFLLARMLYQDGLSALMSFAGLYGAGVFGWETKTLGLFAILATLAAVPGSMLGGVLDDRLGPKRAVTLSVAGLLVAAIGVVSVSPERVFFVLTVAPPPEGGAPFSGRAEQAFLAFGLLAGLCVGPAQAASRTLMARLAPRAMVAEFFGLYALSGKATAFLAPLLIGLVTAASEAQRPGIIVLVVLMALGLALLLTVRVERAALAPEDALSPTASGT